MRKKQLLILLVLVIVCSLLLVSSGFAADKTRIVFMNSKGEIQAQLEQTARVFNRENPGIELSIVTAPVGQSPFERLSALYASGNAPALAMLDGGDVPKFIDKWVDLSEEKWVEDALPGMLTASTYDGKIMTFPFCAEGYGFIYNQTILKKAGVDPASIRTTSDLKEAFEKVQASGVSALVIGQMDWSLGNHFLGLAYTNQSSKLSDVLKFIDDLKAGKIDLASNKVFKGLMTTFDIMKEYNAAKNDPMAADYNKCAELLGTGKVGFYMQGTWVWGMLQNFDPKGAYGYIPVPISDNAADYGNAGIPIGPTKFIGIDKTNNTEAQQAAAKKFLNWLVYSKSGQEATANQMNLIAPFKSSPVPDDPLSKSVSQYLKEGKALHFLTVLPADHWSQTGASMQKYLTNNLDIAGLAKEIEAYWKTQK